MGLFGSNDDYCCKADKQERIARARNQRIVEMRYAEEQRRKRKVEMQNEMGNEQPPKFDGDDYNWLLLLAFLNFFFNGFVGAFGFVIVLIFGHADAMAGNTGPMTKEQWQEAVKRKKYEKEVREVQKKYYGCNH
ncbi:MAG: hypothetical protein MMC33_004688 [Icmadophila ericetorum]|nr:hypothetical protein [Icmadophila ericetorum]